MEELLKYRVYRNDNELKGAFVSQSDAEIYIDAVRVLDDYKITCDGKVIYTTD